MAKDQRVKSCSFTSDSRSSSRRLGFCLSWNAQVAEKYGTRDLGPLGRENGRDLGGSSDVCSSIG